jgi:hypothetical protein
MRFRKLRIAFSATCAIACVLLIALWALSYWWIDLADFPLTSLMRWPVESVQGSWLVFTDNRPVASPQVSQLYTGRFTAAEVENVRTSISAIAPWGFAFKLSSKSLVLCVPQWIPILISGVLCVLAFPSARFRFSVRTLLLNFRHRANNARLLNVKEFVSHCLYCKRSNLKPARAIQKRECNDPAPALLPPSRKPWQCASRRRKSRRLTLCDSDCAESTVLSRLHDATGELSAANSFQGSCRSLFHSSHQIMLPNTALLPRSRGGKGTHRDS